jgi:dGTPase
VDSFQGFLILGMMKWERLLSRGRFGEKPGFIPTQAARSEFEVD